MIGTFDHGSNALGSLNGNTSRKMKRRMMNALMLLVFALECWRMTHLSFGSLSGSATDHEILFSTPTGVSLSSNGLRVPSYPTTVGTLMDRMKPFCQHWSTSDAHNCTLQIFDMWYTHHPSWIVTNEMSDILFFVLSLVMEPNRLSGTL